MKLRLFFGTTLLFVCLLGVAAAIRADTKDNVALLCLAMGDPDPAIRAEASRSISALGEDAVSAVPYLANALTDPDPLVRYEAARALKQIKPHSTLAINALARSLSDSSPDVKGISAEALGQIGAPAKQATASLLEVLKRRDQDGQLSALEALGEIDADPKLAVPVLIPIIENSGNYLLAKAAFVCLGKLGPRMDEKQRKSVLPVLVTGTASPTGSIRYYALKAMQTVAQSSELASLLSPSILRMISDSDEDVRLSLMYFIEKAGIGGSEEIRAIVVKAVQDPYLEVRARALEILYLNPSRDELPLMLQAMTDPVGKVRESAVKAISRVAEGSPTICAELLAVANDRDEDVRTEAVKFLASCKKGPAPVLAVLFKSSQNQSANVRKESVVALAALFDRRGLSGDSKENDRIWGLDETPRHKAVSTIIDSLNDPDETVRSAAADSLLAVAPVGIEYMPKIMAAVEGEFREVHLAAILVLATFGQEARSSQAILTQRLTDDDPRVRAAAAETLGFVAKDKSAVVPIFRKVLQDANDAYGNTESITLAATRALSRSGNDAVFAIPELLMVLRDGETETRTAALETLSMIGEPATEAVQKAVEKQVAESAKSPKPADAKDKVSLVASLSPSGVPTDSLEKLKALQATTSLTLLTRDGKPEKVLLAPKTVLIAVATWCPHSRALIEFLASENVKRMTEGWNLNFVFQDEWKDVQGMLADQVAQGKLSREEEKERLAFFRARAGQSPVFDPSVLEHIPGRVYFVTDESSEATVHDFPSFFSPATKKYEMSGLARAWTEEVLGMPRWMVDEVDW
jgi:HEAT repeat protein